MKEFLGRISPKFKEPDDKESGHIRQLKQEFDAIDIEVQIALKRKLTYDLLPAFNRASTDIPILLERLNDLLSEGKYKKSLMHIFQEALNTYCIACKHFSKSIVENDEREYVRGIKEIEDSRKMLKQAKSLFK